VRRAGAAVQRLGGSAWVPAGGKMHRNALDSDTWLVGRRKLNARALADGTWVISDKRIHNQDLNETTWLVSANRTRAQPVDVVELGTRAWLVRQRSASPQADLAIESQTMKHLAARHVAWLLRRYNINCVLDVGANIGQFAQELRHHGYDGYIISFEPVPQFVDKLRALAAKDDRWTVHQLALGSTEGSLPIRVQHSLSSALTATEYGRRRFASLEKFADDEQIDVPLRRLDAILDEVLAQPAAAGVGEPRIFLKMDTQGFDLEAFRGLGDRAKEILAIQSEVALLTIYEGMPRMPEALATYEAAGFEISGLFPVTREPDGRVIEYDCMMVRPEAFAQGGGST
jgi:FkbM family methyltransferase